MRLANLLYLNEILPVFESVINELNPCSVCSPLNGTIVHNHSIKTGRNLADNFLSYNYITAADADNYGYEVFPDNNFGSRNRV